MPKKRDEITEPTQALDESIEKEAEKVEQRDYASLIQQVEAEYQLGWWFMKPKLDEWAVRLKLYNNQKRDKEAIGDPLLFTIHQTVLASLYGDQLGAEWLARESGDEEITEDLNALTVFDHEEMGKDILDYEWDWDASFFGRGLILNMEFSRAKKCPTPEVIDMMTWLRDPRASSVNGDIKGRGAMKFGGREMRLSENDMDKSGGLYFNYDGLKPDTSDIRSLIDSNTLARATAQGYSDISKFAKQIGDNADFRVLEWFTHWKGKKVLVSLADNRKRVIRYTEIKGDVWPINDRTMYPIAHDWDGVSIPDLIEDKQRARAKVQNLGIKGIYTGLHPTYLFNTNLIKNRGQLDIDFDKHIPVDGNPTGAIQAVKRQEIKREVGWILDVLDTAAQRATATPEIQQGMSPKEARTLGETQLVSSKVDTRYSLSARIFGWSEKRFWKQWYQLYKEHFAADIDEKVVRIVGAMGARWRTLTRDNIVAKTDPDVRIESKVISDARKFNELQQYRLFVKDVIATDPQNSNIRFALRKIGRLSGFDKDDIEQVLPPTVDEMNAEKENEKLDRGEIVRVQIYDDDFIHKEVHNRAADTPQKYAHIEAHNKAEMLKRVKPEFDMVRNRPENPTGSEPVRAPGVEFVKAGANTPAGRTMPAMDNQGR